MLRLSLWLTATDTAQNRPFVSVFALFVFASVLVIVRLFASVLVFAQVSVSVSVSVLLLERQEEQNQ